MDVKALENLFQNVPHLEGNISRINPAMGGSINQSYLVTLDNGQSLFVKTHSAQTIPGMYAAEAKALNQLAEPGAINVPRCLYASDDYLVLEAFTEGRPAPDWQVQMGRGLALLHQATQSARFGFDCDNYLGTTPQDNTWRDHWITFWREQRLAPQFTLYAQQAGHEDALLKKGEQLLNQLDEVLAGDPEPGVLLHGDLWSGNAAANAKGAPVIYDPASYYGHREAEFGMMRLFGGFDQECEAAYQEIWPFQSGYDRRIEVYRLYHQLNHLNLFGSSYYEGCLTTLKRLL